MKIEILDIGINNISSIYRSVYECMGDEDEVSIITDSVQSNSPNLIIMPGLGHFKTGMKNLRTTNFDDLIKSHVGSGGWIAGICLGMQLLCDVSEEAPGISGLGIVNASVKKLPPKNGYQTLDGIPLQKLSTHITFRVWIPKEISILCIHFM